MSNMHHDASPEIFQRARELRDHPTKAEEALWEAINAKKLGFKFRRQHPINHFIVDFYCHQAKLVIEVDGAVHDDEEQKDYDKGRESELGEMGLKVIRFNNEEVLNNLEMVLDKIRACLRALIP